MKKILVVYDLEELNQKDKCDLVDKDDNKELEKVINYIKFIKGTNIRGYYLDTDLGRIEELR